MVQDTLQNKQLIGMFLFQEGWQEDYYGNPAIHSIGCAGELIHVENLPEGKFNIILRGISRVRALETIQEAPYRRVRVHILPDTISADRHSVNRIKKRLLEEFKVFQGFLQESATGLSKDCDLIEVVNYIATTLHLDTEEKRRLLELDDAYQRALAVQDHLSAAVSVLKLTAGFGHLRPVDPNVN
jgi:Lon protease-like protein